MSLYRAQFHNKFNGVFNDATLVSFLGYVYSIISSDPFNLLPWSSRRFTSWWLLHTWYLGTCLQATFKYMISEYSKYLESLKWAARNHHCARRTAAQQPDVPSLLGHFVSLPTTWMPLILQLAVAIVSVNLFPSVVKAARALSLLRALW